MEVCIRVPFAPLHRRMHEHYNLQKEAPVLVADLTKKPGDAERLSVDSLLAGENERWYYAVYQFFPLMFQFPWVKDGILTMSIKSVIINPLENGINLVC